MRLILITILLLIISKGFAQVNIKETQLANEYFRNHEFDKAAELYQNIFKKTSSKIYFDYYLRCLIELEQYKEAEKAVKKQMKKQPYELSYLVELGYLYKTQGKTDLASQNYEEALKRLSSNRTQIIELANSFLRKRELEYAEKAYLKGRKLSKGDYEFSFELASVYQAQRQYGKMIDEYLDLLEKEEAYIQSVQNRLQSAVYNDIENNLNDLLKNKLIERIQKNPDAGILSELLIWLYIQERSFDKAMQLAKALDKRNKEYGERLMALGKMAMTNEQYATAVKCFQYVLNYKNSSPYYIKAKNEYLSALFQKITKSTYTETELQELESSYFQTIEELGISSKVTQMLIELSHLQAFYLNKGDEAIKRLEEALSIPGLKQSDIAQIKMELGDILVQKENMWEAILYYAQIEKSNKNNSYGYEAKLRKAKLAYFTGDFQWAQAQLDVLKASTSKRIANDAFQLSQLINDNTALDTSLTAMKMFANADLLIFQNKDSLALQTFDSIINDFKGHSLIDDILFRKATIAKRNGKYNNAVSYYKQIMDMHSDILADDATFYLALLYEKQLNNKDKAMELYRDLLTGFPGSIYVVDARKKYRILRGDNIDTENLFFYNEENTP
ncbi:MAG: hypothetical protein C0594_07680 [Marinilabiliales bacterium]|nr:MAG: hypothetical protein C0594_07680 [Marinilabiliales bacterium]